MLLILRTLRQLVPLLPARARRFIGWYIVATSLLAAVDVVAIALLAISPIPLTIVVYSMCMLAATDLISYVYTVFGVSIG